MTKVKDERLALNLAEAAELAGVSVPIMRQLVNRKGFPALRIGRRLVIPVEPFKEWLSTEAYKGV